MHDTFQKLCALKVRETNEEEYTDNCSQLNGDISWEA